MWNMLITMTTVGYGDTYAKSHMGRLIGLVIASFGAFYMGLFVNALIIILDFDSTEKKSFNLL